MRIKLAHVATVPVTLNYFLRGQIEYMKDKGLEVLAVASPGPMLDELAERTGIEGFGIYMHRGISPLTDLVTLARLLALFRRHKPTVVHGSTAKAGLMSMLAAALAGTPVRVYTLRGLMLETRTGMARGLLRITELLTCLLAHRVFAVSHSVARQVVRHKLCPQDKVRVLRNGSSNGVEAVDRFNPSNVTESTRRKLRNDLSLPFEARILGYVGRLVGDKGVTDLIEAWKTIREQEEDLFLVMIGPFENHDPVSRSVMEIVHSDSRIVRKESVPNDLMPSYYSIMDLLILPTYREGFPNVLLEAAAMELPVVATRVTGCVDAVEDGVTGTLVPSRNPQALAQAALAYLRDPALGRGHGTAARQRVIKDFCPADIWDALYLDYLDLMRERGVNP